MMNMTKLMMIGLMIALLVLTGCGTKTESATPLSEKTADKTLTDKTPIKIGLIGPFTGSSAIYGKWGRSGAEFALKEAGGLTVEYEDSACDPKTGVSAFTKLTETDNVDVIVSSDCSTPTLSYLPLAQQKGIPTIVTTAAATSVADAGDFVFRTRYSAEGDAIAIADFANANGWKDAAVLYQDTDSGITTLNGIESRFKGNLVAKEKYDLKDTDVRSHLTKIKDSKPDAIIMLTQGDLGAIILRQINELALTVPIIGVGAQLPPTTITAAGKYAEGLYATFPQFDTDSCKPCNDFKSRFKEGTNEDSSYTLSTTYDAVKLISIAGKKCGHDRACIRDSLASTSDYPGASAVITFDEKGELRGSQLGIKQVRNGRFEEVK